MHKRCSGFLFEQSSACTVRVKAGDSAYELLSAQGANDAYEKACCGACDAVESRISK